MVEMIQFIARSSLFIPHFEKTKVHSSSGKLSLFSQQNLDFKNSSDVEMRLEEEEIKRFKD